MTIRTVTNNKSSDGQVIRSSASSGLHRSLTSFIRTGLLLLMILILCTSNSCIPFVASNSLLDNNNNNNANNYPIQSSSPSLKCVDTKIRSHCHDLQARSRLSEAAFPTLLAGSQNDHISDESTLIINDEKTAVVDAVVDNNQKQQSSSLKRGEPLGDQFDEQDLLRAYREIQSEYHKKAFSKAIANEWKTLSTFKPKKTGNDDQIIKVSLLEHPSDPYCPYVKMEAVLPVPVQECWNFLLLDRWDETMPKMDPFYEGVDIFGEYYIQTTENSRQVKGTDNNKKGHNHLNGTGDRKSSFPTIRPPPLFGFGKKSSELFSTKSAPTSSSAVAADGNASGIHMILARKRTKRILTFGKREFVFISVKDEPLHDGTWVSGTVSVDSPTKFPRTKSYTRAFQDSIAFYKPIKGKDSNQSNSRTKLTIVCRIDLNDSTEDGTGGWIPMWLYVKTIGATGVRSVLNMRKALLEDREEQLLIKQKTKAVKHTTTKMSIETTTNNYDKQISRRRKDKLPLSSWIPKWGNPKFGPTIAAVSEQSQANASSNQSQLPKDQQPIVQWFSRLIPSTDNS